MKNAPKNGFALYPVEAGGQITFPHLIIPRHRNLKFPFPPQPVFAESRPILGLLVADFGNNYSQNLGATKEDLHLRGGDSVNWGVSLLKKYFFATTEAGLGIVPENGLFKIPPWGGQIKPVKEQKTRLSMGSQKGSVNKRP